MKPLNQFLHRAPVKAVSERSEFIDFFVREINIERKGTQFPPISPKTVAIKVGHINTKDLYALKSKMLDAQRRNFPIGVVFFTETKTTKV